MLHNNRRMMELAFSLLFSLPGTPMLLTLHNFSRKTQKVSLKPGGSGTVLIEVFDGRHSRPHSDGTHHIELQEYAWRWYRVGAADNTLNRSDLTLTAKEQDSSV